MKSPAPKVKETYHGPRLSRFLPHFLIGIAAVEVAFLVVGGT